MPNTVRLSARNTNTSGKSAKFYSTWVELFQVIDCVTKDVVRRAGWQQA